MNKKESFFSFYSALHRPFTILELASYLNGVGNSVRTIEEGTEKNRLVEENGFFISAQHTKGFGMMRRKQDLLLDEKWKLLSRQVRWFRFIPFVEFVVASGSMAIGNVNRDSDFDVLVGVRKGRIFTTRYLINFVFSVLRSRRLDDHEGTNPDKLCFNHFVTEESFAKEPFNFYRAELYRHMIPIYGSREALEAFFAANAWSGASPENNMQDLRFCERQPNAIRSFFSFVLGGKFGDSIERKIMEPIARKRLGAYITGKAQKGRVIVSEEELEFHFKLPYEERFICAPTSSASLADSWDD